MRRLFLSAAGVLIAALTTVAAQQPPAPASDDNWMPDSVKNLTVLPKDTSPDEVMKIMRTWNEALKVDCVFCHVGQIGKPLSTYDFASDNKKRKEVSRVMLQASMDMNEKFKTLGDEPPTVQCSTCHKRSRHVDADLPPAAAAKPQP
jgi:hypothetical protein